MKCVCAESQVSPRPRWMMPAADRRPPRRGLVPPVFEQPAATKPTTATRTVSDGIARRDTGVSLSRRWRCPGRPLTRRTSECRIISLFLLWRMVSRLWRAAGWQLVIHRWTGGIASIMALRPPHAGETNLDDGRWDGGTPRARVARAATSMKLQLHQGPSGVVADHGGISESQSLEQLAYQAGDSPRR